MAKVWEVARITLGRGDKAEQISVLDMYQALGLKVLPIR
jgi:hypothetical protein